MRSPGLSVIIHTRVRSFSDKRCEPTHGFGFLPSRSNSATSSGDHCDLSLRSGALSSMVRVIDFLHCDLPSYIASPAASKAWDKALGEGESKTRSGGRRFDERAARGSAAATRRLE